MRPGALLVPFCVWHELQSPLSCGVTITRSPASETTLAV